MNDLFINILSWIFGWVNNYGWSVIIFTMLIKIVLLPLDVKSRKSMRAMSLHNPQLEVLKKRYANDQEKLNRKTQELYRQNHVNPLSGCLPILIQMPILIIMFTAMRRVAAMEQVRMMYKWAQDIGLANVNELTKEYQGLNWDKLAAVADDIENYKVSFGETQSWFWIKSVFQADNMSRYVIPTVSELNTTLGQYGEYMTRDELPEAVKFVQDYIASMGLGSEDRLALIKAGLSSLEIGESSDIYATIHAVIDGSAEGVTIESILAGIREARPELAEDADVLYLIQYCLQGGDSVTGEMAEGVRSFLNGAANVNESLKAQVLGLLDYGKTELVFGSEIDTALEKTVDPYTEKILGLFSISVPRHFNRYVNGYYILPVLACATQVLATKLQPNAADQQAAQPTGKDGKPASTGKIMKWLFPVMSIFICWTSSAAFAIYWVFVNVWGIISSYAINFYLVWKEKAGGRGISPKNDKSSDSNNKKEALQP